MPRNGGGVYSLPAGSIVTDGVDDILAAQHNDPLNDIALDMNTARPVVAGGTGATTASGALVNLGLTATAAEINVLDGIPGTLTATELGYVDGVTSAIQTQLNAKQASDATLTSLSGLSLVEGDTLYATAADTLANLPKGAAFQVYAMNAGATAPEWVLGDLFFRLNVDFAGANATGAQNLLPQNVTLLASTQYEYEIFYSLQKIAGVTSHTVSTLWGGTATFNNFRRNLLTTSVNASAYAGVLASFGADNSPTTPINASGTVNFADARVHIREMGTFSVNAGGTVIPQYQLSSAPGGAYSTTAGAFFALRPLGASGANISRGSWA